MALTSVAPRSRPISKRDERLFGIAPLSPIGVLWTAPSESLLGAMSRYIRISAVRRGTRQAGREWTIPMNKDAVLEAISETFGDNAGFAMELYTQYQTDPTSVGESWQQAFVQ